MCWSWLPGPPWSLLVTAARSGQSRMGPKVPQGVWREILSLAPTPAPSRAPEMQIFLPSRCGSTTIFYSLGHNQAGQ